MSKIDDQLTGRILGCAVKVSKILGPGFLEKVYENALMVELRREGVRAEQQKPLTVKYEGEVVGECAPDILVEGAVIVELKAAQSVGRVQEAQVLHYLKATGLRRGLLLNFGLPKLGIRRLVF